MIVNYQLKIFIHHVKKKSKHKNWLVVRKTGFYDLQMISGEEKIRSKKYQM